MSAREMDGPKLLLQAEISHHFASMSEASSASKMLLEKKEKKKRLPPEL